MIGERVDKIFKAKGRTDNLGENLEGLEREGGIERERESTVLLATAKY